MIIAKNKKKVISLLTALTLVLSMFAGFASMQLANASTVIIPPLDENHHRMDVSFTEMMNYHADGTKSPDPGVKVKIKAKELPEGSYLENDGKVYGVFGGEQEYNETLMARFSVKENSTVKCPDGTSYRVHLLGTSTPPSVAVGGIETSFEESYGTFCELILNESSEVKPEDEVQALRSELKQKDNEIKNLKKEVGTLSSKLTDANNKLAAANDKIAVLSFKSITPKMKVSKKTLKVTKVSKAKGYVVYKKQAGKWKKFKTISKTNLKVKKGSYKIKAYTKIGGKSVYSKYSKVVKVK